MDDELSLKARAVLDAARNADDPSAQDRVRIDAAFAHKLAGLHITATAATSAATQSAPGARHAFGGSAKLALLAALGLGGAIGIWQLEPWSFGGVAPALRGGATSSAARPVTAAPPVNPIPSAAPPPAVPVAQPHESARDPNVPAEIVRVPTLKTEAKPARGPNTRLVSQDTLREETALIASANAALRAQRFERAEQMLARHAARFAEGALAEERRGLRVLALCGSGQRALGLHEREQFLQRTSDSVLADRVRMACQPNAARKGVAPR